MPFMDVAGLRVPLLRVEKGLSQQGDASTSSDEGALWVELPLGE